MRLHHMAEVWQTRNHTNPVTQSDIAAHVYVPCNLSDLRNVKIALRILEITKTRANFKIA